MIRRPGWSRLASFFLLLGGLLVVWVLYHARPQQVPEPLFTQQDLQFDTLGEQNGWDALKSFLGEEDGTSRDLEIPPELEDFLGFPDYPDTQTAIAFFNRLRPKLPALNNFIFSRINLINKYKTILSIYRFVDTTPPRIQENSKFLMAYLDLHKVARLYILNLYAQLKFQEAYGFWTQMFKKDVAWLETAHSPLSHLMAVGEVSRDLKQLNLLQTLSPPQDPGPILSALEDFAPQDLSFRNALIFEYLVFLNAEEEVFEEIYEDQGVLTRFFFNEAQLRKDINLEYQRLVKYLDNPEILTPKFIEAAQQQTMDSNASWQDWLINPGGNTLKRILSPNLLTTMRNFYSQKRKLVKLQENLIRNLKNPPSAQRPQEGPETQAGEIAQPNALPENFDLQVQLDREPDVIREIEIPLKAWQEDAKAGVLEETLRLKAQYAGEELRALEVEEILTPSPWDPFVLEKGDRILAIDGQGLAHEDVLFELAPPQIEGPTEILIFRLGKFHRIEIFYIR